MGNEKVNVTLTWPMGTILTLIFIVLKLTGHINWSWWWVLSPVWIGLALVLLIILIMLLYYAISNKR